MDRQIPTQVGMYSDWAVVFGGGWHSLGIRSNGTLWAWGDNTYGQLGLAVGDTQDRYIPTQVGTYSDWVRGVGRRRAQSGYPIRWISLGLGTQW